MPEETKQLLEVTAIKVQCKSLGIPKLDAGQKGAVFAFREDTILDPARLLDVVRSRPSQIRIRPDSKLVHSGLGGTPEERLAGIRKFLKELEAAAGLVPA